MTSLVALYFLPRWPTAYKSWVAKIWRCWSHVAADKRQSEKMAHLDRACTSFLLPLFPFLHPSLPWIERCVLAHPGESGAEEFSLFWSFQRCWWWWYICSGYLLHGWVGRGGRVGWGGAKNAQSSTFFGSRSCASNSKFQQALASALWTEGHCHTLMMLRSCTF